MKPLRFVQHGINLLKSVLKISPLETTFPALPVGIHLAVPASVRAEGYHGISQASMSTLEKQGYGKQAHMRKTFQM